MKCGLIGKTLKHSWSKEIHEKIFDYDYDLIELEKDQLEGFIKDNPYRGLNVTIPYKRDVIKYCDHISPIARQIGSVNTLVYDKNDKLYGYNTDYYGFLYMLKQAGIDIDGKDVIILGSGGTGKTVEVAVDHMNPKSVNIISRRGDNTYDDLDKFRDSQIIINTTPVGMYPCSENSIIDLSNFTKCTSLADVIYNPMKTRLIQQAEQRKIITTNGLPMLVAQAKYAGSIFNGDFSSHEKIEVITDKDIMRITQYITDTLTNIVLIGMSGCGKTEVGKVLSQKTGKTFIDIDVEIENQERKPISNIFSEHGEAYFRDLETKAIEKYGKECGQIISTGGGSVLRDENIRNLEQNGVFVWLQRDIKLIDDDSLKTRPLLKDQNAALKLYSKREPIYEDLSELIVQNSGKIEKTADEVLKCFYERNGEKR